MENQSSPPDISTERLTHQNILMDSLGTLCSVLPIFFWSEKETDVINKVCYTLIRVQQDKDNTLSRDKQHQWVYTAISEH